MRSYVVLGTNRFEAMVSFYRERLGLMEVDRWDQPDGRGVFLELPGLLVKIVDNDRERSPLILSASLDRLTEEFDGQYRIKSEPPLLVPIRELGRKLPELTEKLFYESYQSYVSGVAPDCRVLLKKYKPIDCALKVVGVGSVGTRCWILLLEGRDRSDPLFLQMKQATHSALAEHLAASPYESHGRRVVEGQRLMQTVNDVLLGWTQNPETGHHYYWRQLRDWKGSVDVDDLEAADLNSYGPLCAWTLARAHARSGDLVAIAAYLGSSDTFDHALTEFAERYADQNERDYEAFLEQIRQGRLQAAAES